MRNKNIITTKNTMKRKEERTTVKDKDYLDVGKWENRKEILTKVKEVRKEMREEKKNLIRKGERLG